MRPIIFRSFVDKGAHYAKLLENKIKNVISNIL